MRRACSDRCNFSLPPSRSFVAYRLIHRKEKGIPVSSPPEWVWPSLEGQIVPLKTQELLSDRFHLREVSWTPIESEVTDSQYNLCPLWPIEDLSLVCFTAEKVNISAKKSKAQSFTSFPLPFQSLLPLSADFFQQEGYNHSFCLLLFSHFYLSTASLQKFAYQKDSTQSPKCHTQKQMLL